jgi:hypothetical protein
VGPAPFRRALKGLFSMIRTTLAIARGCQNIISGWRRLNQRLPASVPENNDLHIARCMLDIASVQITEGRLTVAIGTLREALGLGSRGRYVAFNKKQRAAPDKDARWFFQKIRELKFLSRDDYHLLLPVLNGGKCVDANNAERFAIAISKIVDLPEAAPPTPRDEWTQRPAPTPPATPAPVTVRPKAIARPIPEALLKELAALDWPEPKMQQRLPARAAAAKHAIAMVRVDDDEFALDDNIRERAWALRRGEPMPELSEAFTSEAARMNAVLDAKNRQRDERMAGAV